MIAESDAPAACICVIFSFAGCEKSQASMLHVATVSEHPHWQASLAPTRCVSIFWSRLGICACVRTAAHRARRMSLLLDRDILLGNADHFGARILQFDLARNQRDQGAENQDDPAGPDPGDQRKDISLNH